MPIRRWLKKVFTGKSSNRIHGTRRTKSFLLGQEIKLQNLEKVLKELECPVCFTTCVPPISTCIRGHIICSKCKKSLRICPICREQFSDARNLFAEQFVEQYSQKCKFVDDGCDFLKWKGDDMRDHEELCFYRNVKCISCHILVPYKELLNHLIEVHKIIGKERIPVTVNYLLNEEMQMTDKKWLPYYIKVFGCTFYVTLEIIRPHFWAWVWVHPPRIEDLSNYSFMASLQLSDFDKNISLEWKGPVYPIRTPARLITQEGLCFGGAEALLAHFKNDGLISLLVNIEKRVSNVSISSALDENSNCNYIMERQSYHLDILSSSTELMFQPSVQSCPSK